MAQVFKLFCFSISVLLFLQLTDAADSKKSPDKDTELNGQDGKEQRPIFLQTVDTVKSSSPVIMVKKVTSIAGKHLSKFSEDFETELKAESAKQVNDGNSLIPNAITNNMLLPAKALVKTSLKTLKEPVQNIYSSVKKTYVDELAKSEQNEDYVPIIGAFTKGANKPVALLRASRDIVGNTLGSIFGKASSFWSSIKKNEAEKSEKKDD